MFGRKYIFETKKTRAMRVAFNSVLGFFVFTIFYASYLLFIMVAASSEETRKTQGLYQKAPEAIVVFTGDKGRIKRALELTASWPEAQVLISGVHGSNTLKTIVAGHDDAERLLNSPVQVEIDYEALDTLGNVRETLDHLDESKDRVKRVLVVTSDYHVMRVRMIFKYLLKDRDYEIYYEGVPSTWSNFTNIKKLLKESVKALRVWLVLNLS